MSLASATVRYTLISTLLAVVYQMLYSISPERDLVLLRSDTSAWAASGAYANFNGVALFYHAQSTSTHGKGAERERSNDGRGSAQSCGKGEPTLVLLHGFPTSSFDFVEAWDDIVDTAAAAGISCVVAMDFVGFGLSDKPAAHAFDYSIHAQADAVEWLVGRYLGLKTAGVLAHDYGSTVAQELLARITLASPDEAAVVPFVLLNAGLLPEAHRPRTVQWLLAHFPSLSYLVGRPMYQRTLAGVFGPETQPSQDWLDAAWALMAHKGGAVLGGTLLHYMGDRIQHRERWLAGMTAALGKAHGASLCIINGPADPISGAHMIANLRKVMGDGITVHSLSPLLGHWPLSESKAEAINAFRQCLGFQPV